MDVDDELLVRFCAIECSLQHSGELSVYHMIEAWLECAKMSLPFTHEYIQHIGRLVEPEVNRKGYRTVDVRVGSSIKPPHQEVPALMEVFLRMTSEGTSDEVLTPDQWFFEYEEIHPFRDGNGRTGVIFYNKLRGSMDSPTWPADPYDDPRRSHGWGSS